MRALFLIIAGGLLAGCPPSYVHTDLDGNWAAPDGTVLEVRGPQVRVLAVETFSYPENDPPCTGFVYVWCKAALALNTEAEPRQLEITYPPLLDGSTIVYCRTDANTVGYNWTLTAGSLTQEQSKKLQDEGVEAMLDTMRRLSGVTVPGIYEVVDPMHRRIVLAEPEADRPETFDDAQLFRRDTRSYAPVSLGTFCAG